MSNGASLHVGLNQVDAGYYGSTLPLAGCHNDARDMAAIAIDCGLRATILRDAEATTGAVLEHLQRAATQLGRDDLFVLTYAGHGAQVPDQQGDEADGLDEAWVLFDRMLLDDEIYAALSGFIQGVRVLLISDSCHSGSLVRAREYREAIAARGSSRRLSSTKVTFRIPDEHRFGHRICGEHQEQYAALSRVMPANPRELVRASVIQIAACQDDQLSADGDANGLFTSTLKKVWAQGRFVGSHRAFFQAIAREMPAVQSPNYLILGAGTGAFEQQRPFSLKSITTNQGETPMTTQEVASGNWAEVCAELERRIPNWELPAVLNGFSDSHSPSGAAGVAARNGATTSVVSSASATGAVRAAFGAPIVRTFFWGFHVEISSNDLRQFLSVADPVNAIIATIGPMTGPAAPFIVIAAGFIAGALQWLRSSDRGNGVYVSMSWFAPAVFIVTAVPPARGVEAPARARGPGDAYEQAGDPWYRDYGGGLFGLRLEEDILWNLPDGTVRENVVVNLNPPGFGNVYFNGWLSPDDPTVGHFRLHVGVASFRGGRVNVRMTVRDAAGRRSVVDRELAGPRALAPNEVFDAPSNGVGTHLPA